MKVRQISLLNSWLNPRQIEVNSDLHTSLAPDQLVSPSIYEGGNELWECSNDLAEFIKGNEIQFELEQPNELYVLDLGCGRSLPTVEFCTARELRGLKSVVFCQDLNLDVFKHTTYHAFEDGNNDNVTETLTKIVLICCPWDEMCDRSSLWGDLKFDLCISSETLYRPVHFEMIYKILTNRLRDTGRALFAQKSYYFGLGGGSIPFLEFIAHKDNMKAKVLKKLRDGKSNVRDILEISHSR